MGLGGQWPVERCHRTMMLIPSACKTWQDAEDRSRVARQPRLALGPTTWVEHRTMPFERGRARGTFVGKPARIRVRRAIGEATRAPVCNHLAQSPVRNARPKTYPQAKFC